MARQVRLEDGTWTFDAVHICFWDFCHDVAWVFPGDLSGHDMAMAKWPKSTTIGVVYFEESVLIWVGVVGLVLVFQHLATPGATFSLLTMAQSGPPPRIGEVLAPCIACWFGATYLIMAIIWTALLGYVWLWVVWYLLISGVGFTCAGFGLMRVKAASL
eukprot:CAMPEP_0204343850 /NCGR_PEP_ID=MMETSP0469-20131031/25200_1 /ASSEMBLY_ACC=CAM_ASM_000384 /TAXON_ID=2969 /ORGANISM="Oxyrrhis marina" /LENGTH=158 /DNA_ID=CAMNT_0051329015 /DNA_START=116 /DNA_END=588 /DNA_ORIENTATION=-